MDIFVDEVYSLQIRLRKGKMNAYELADYLEKSCHICAITSATMLRQQADRIAELEKDLHMIQRHYDQLDTQLHPQTKPSIEERHGIK